MFESAEVGNKVEKDEFKERAQKLRLALIEAQRQLAGSKTALLLIIAGVEGAGKTEFANRLLEWVDTRGVEVHAWSEPTDEERGHPFFWRYWKALPPKGKSALLLNSWYTQPIIDRVFKRMDNGKFDQWLDDIVHFERMLTREGLLVVKLWFHISEDEQKKRLKKLERDPDTRWRVTGRDWEFHKKYSRFRKHCEHAIMQTSSSHAPWQIIEATDKRYRDITGARHVLDALKRRLAEAKAEKRPARKPDMPKPKPRNVLRNLDLSRKLTRKTYEKRLEKAQGRLGLLTRRLRDDGRSMILVFEGPDAAGKGGAIRRLTRAMDARIYRVNSVAAPTDEEKAHPYLWRFWRQLPLTGRVSIYDRSWYGRVLVERLEGFATREEWRRAYSEINAFEDQLTDFGTIVIKFWIAISSQEQLKRFKDRQQKPYKQYKITEEDWRNRAKWNAYEAAACEMMERTSTRQAPWVLVEGNDKLWARVKVVETVVAALKKEL